MLGGNLPIFYDDLYIPLTLNSNPIGCSDIKRLERLTKPVRTTNGMPQRDNGDVKEVAWVEPITLIKVNDDIIANLPKILG